jgi:hypothetical protein
MNLRNCPHLSLSYSIKTLGPARIQENELVIDALGPDDILLESIPFHTLLKTPA